MNQVRELDEIDVRLLELLQDNGRMTSTRLAKNVGLSAPSVLDRIRKLEDRGVIEGYAALLNPAKVGRSLVAFVLVSLTFHREGSMGEFKEAVRNSPQVLECYHVSGEGDFLLKVVVKDIDSYRDYLVRDLTRLEVVQRVTTMIVFDTLKHETKLEMGNLLEQGHKAAKRSD
ncbi:MAG: Lrp/AsnC family transcriptional regulator [Deltaproteobacteria bacterium]|nr:Lrp/AsnC family transcriptional regulator [Deltaproteobacteria bacterium]